MRLDLEEPATYIVYVAAFFKDLVDAYVEEYKEGIPQKKLADGITPRLKALPGAVSRPSRPDAGLDVPDVLDPGNLFQKPDLPPSLGPIE